MTDFRAVTSFEDLWRPLGTRSLPDKTIRKTGRAANVRERLGRIVNRAPEVVVNLTSVLRSGDQLRRHLAYVSRKGALALEDADRCKIEGRDALRELADDWIWGAGVDSQRQSNRPLARALVLSMPAGTDRSALKGAAQAFAEREFGGRFDHVLVEHRDGANPHVHLVVRALGVAGERFGPKLNDLARMRETFAAALRERGVDAEATPRYARGVVLKAENRALRRLRLRFEAGIGPCPEAFRRTILDVVELVGRGEEPTGPWTQHILYRRKAVRAAYEVAANALASSGREEDAALAGQIQRFLRDLPPPLTRDGLMAQRVRAAAAEARLPAERDRTVKSVERERSR